MNFSFVKKINDFLKGEIENNVPVLLIKPFVDVSTRVPETNYTNYKLTNSLIKRFLNIKHIEKVL